MANIIESYYYIKVGSMFYGEVGLGKSTQLYDNLANAKKFSYTSDTEDLIKYDVTKTAKSLTNKNLEVSIHKREAQITYKTIDMEFVNGSLVEVTPVEQTPDGSTTTTAPETNTGDVTDTTTPTENAGTTTETETETPTETDGDGAGVETGTTPTGE